MDGYVLAGNRAMLALDRRLGFEVGPSGEGPAVRRVRLALVSEGCAVPAAAGQKRSSTNLNG